MNPSKYKKGIFPPSTADIHYVAYAGCRWQHAEACIVLTGMVLVVGRNTKTDKRLSRKVNDEECPLTLVVTTMNYFAIQNAARVSSRAIRQRFEMSSRTIHATPT
jgi:hypothetical protein